MSNAPGLSKLPQMSTTEYVNLMPSKAEGKLEMGFSNDPRNMQIISQLLTDQYGDPIEATVRETVSNAIDASRERAEQDGSEVPYVTIDVDYLGMTATIADQGVGMSLEHANQHFVKFANSSKSYKMNLIGAYGLGSKAPLAYNTTFTIESTHEGNTIVFTMTKSASGFEAKVLSNSHTGKASGTKIIIPIKSRSDGERFLEVARRYAKWNFGSRVKVDGVAVENDQWFPVDEIVIHPESGTTGRIWANKNAGTLSLRGSDYSLGGWLYENPDYTYYRYTKEPDTNSAILEIAPGVLDFPASRDAVTKNERSWVLNKIFTEHLESEEFQYKLANSFMEQLSEKDVVLYVSRLWGRNRTVFTKTTLLEDNGANDLYAILTEKDDAPKDVLSSGNLSKRYGRTRMEWSCHGNSMRPGDITDLTLGMPSMSLSNALWGVVMDTSHGDPVYFVTGIDEDNCKKANSMKGYFLSYVMRDGNKSGVQLIFLSPGATISASQQAIMDIMGYNVITMDDYIEKARSARPARSKNGGSAVPRPDVVNRDYRVHGAKYKGRLFTEMGGNNLDGSTIIQADLVILSHDNYALTKLGFGAGNAGHDVENSFIVYVPTLSVALFNELDPSQILFERGYVAPNKALEKFIEDNPKKAIVRAETMRSLYTSLSNEELAEYIRRESGVNIGDLDPTFAGVNWEGSSGPVVSNERLYHMNVSSALGEALTRNFSDSELKNIVAYYHKYAILSYAVALNNHEFYNGLISTMSELASAKLDEAVRELKSDMSVRTFKDLFIHH